MKGVILHGGSGTRLRPLTYSDVKQLLPIAGKPISEYALQNLISIGINEVNIVIGSVGGEEVKKYYGNGEKWGVDITYTYQEKALGIAQAIQLVKNFVGKDSFVVYLGDNFLQTGISDLAQEFKNGKFSAMLALTEVRNPQQFGIAEINKKKIVRLVEKPNEPKSNLAITGVYFLTPDIFVSIEKLQPSRRGEYEITEALQDMIDRHMNVGYAIISGWFKDTGTVEDFLDCNRLVLDSIEINPSAGTVNSNVSGRAYLSENVEISKDSRILGPCYIGNGTHIENSYISPFTSIGSNCIIRNADIGNSIVMDGATIDLSERFYIRESLIGADVSITDSGNGSKALKLVLGRDSRIEMK
ncbi:MAG: glucose-1-phosphate thymidylyltransferase [Thermoplasmatales archaeon]